MKKQEKNKLKYFIDGDIPSLIQVMDRREERVFYIKKLLNEKDNVVISFKLNIPGEIKNNSKILEVFNIGKENIKKTLKENKLEIIKDKEFNLITGPEYIALINSRDSLNIKKLMVAIEENGLGRLYDIDVENRDGAISRKELDIKDRKCFICDNSSKVCSRSRAHSVEDMLLKIESIIEENLE